MKRVSAQASFERKEIIGHGRSSVVHLVEKEGKPFAMKKMSKAIAQGERWQYVLHHPSLASTRRYYPSAKSTF
jgi:hypothetical protein